MTPKLSFLFASIIYCTTVTVAQQKNPSSLRFEASAGNLQGSVAISYNYNWLWGKKEKLEFGLGARFTSYFGNNQHYETAPAAIRSGGPGNIDTLLIGSPQLNTFNLMVGLGYRLSDKFSVGLNIDVIGFSFGGSKPVIYINGSQRMNAIASPTSPNILLIDNNDRGSLNSQFFVRYKINEKWSIKAGFQHLFTEYTTETKVQQLPEPNDRFRNKSTLFSAGVRYHLK